MIWKIIKKPFEPIIKVFQNMEIYKIYYTSSLLYFNFLNTNFKIFMLDLWEIIKWLIIYMKCIRYKCNIIYFTNLSKLRIRYYKIYIFRNYVSKFNCYWI